MFRFSISLSSCAILFHFDRKFYSMQPRPCTGICWSRLEGCMYLFYTMVAGSRPPGTGGLPHTSLALPSNTFRGYRTPAPWSIFVRTFFLYISTSQSGLLMTLKTFWEKEKMLVTSIFSFSQSVFYPSQNQFQILSHTYFIV